MRNDESPELAVLRQIEKHAKSIRHNVGCLALVIFVLAAMAIWSAMHQSLGIVSQPPTARGPSNP